MKKILSIQPPNYGWLEAKLDKEEIDYLWECIRNKGSECNTTLAGNISSSCDLSDKENWFFDRVLAPLISTYCDTYPYYVGIQSPLGNKFNPDVNHPLVLHRWWVNYQKQGEFNPPHNHRGRFSFIIFMKIPIEYEDQKRDVDFANNSNNDSISSLSFQYNTLLGDLGTFNYKLGKWAEGTLLLFPSSLTHGVFPFYNCDEDRITIAGNITMDTSMSLPDSEVTKDVGIGGKEVGKVTNFDLDSPFIQNKNDVDKTPSNNDDRWWERGNVSNKKNENGFRGDDNEWVSGGDKESGFGL